MVMTVALGDRLPRPKLHIKPEQESVLKKGKCSWVHIRYYTSQKLLTQRVMEWFCESLAEVAIWK